MEKQCGIGFDGFLTVFVSLAQCTKPEKQCETFTRLLDIVTQRLVTAGRERKGEQCVGSKRGCGRIFRIDGPTLVASRQEDGQEDQSLDGRIVVIFCCL